MHSAPMRPVTINIRMMEPRTSPPRRLECHDQPFPKPRPASRICTPTPALLLPCWHTQGPHPALPSPGAARVAVLDEADKMLGLGFKPQLDRLKGLLLPPSTAGGAAAKRRRVQVGEGATCSRLEAPPAAACTATARAARCLQVALFTATLPTELDEVAASWQHQPHVVRLGGAEGSISRTVTQVVQVCAEHKKVSPWGVWRAARCSLPAGAYPERACKLSQEDPALHVPRSRPSCRSTWSACRRPRKGCATRPASSSLSTGAQIVVPPSPAQLIQPRRASARPP